MHVVGVSSQAAGHKTLVPQLIEALRTQGARDVVVVVGGVIPAHDYDFLHDARCRARSSARAPTSAAPASEILALVRERRAAMTPTSELARRGARRRPARARAGDHARRVDPARPPRRRGRAARGAAARDGGATRVGISGAPGAGKSTFIEALGMHLVDAGHRVAVLAVDPSSARSGGSILGDKTRMEQLSRRAGGVHPPVAVGRHARRASRAAPREALLVCEAAGFDVVLVETVGVGQSEVAVAGMVDLFVPAARAGRRRRAAGREARDRRARRSRSS